MAALGRFTSQDIPIGDLTDRGGHWTINGLELKARKWWWRRALHLPQKRGHLGLRLQQQLPQQLPLQLQVSLPLLICCWSCLILLQAPPQHPLPAAIHQQVRPAGCLKEIDIQPLRILSDEQGQNGPWDLRFHPQLSPSALLAACAQLHPSPSPCTQAQASIAKAAVWALCILTIAE